MPTYNYKPTTKTCPYCKETFDTGGRGRPPRDQVFCGKECSGFARLIYPNIKQLPVITQSYIAGLFDGEGSIIMWDRGYGGRKQLKATISNTYAPIMKWLCEATGTGSVVKHVYPIETGYKDSYTWQLYGQNAVALLHQLMPFLIIKRDKAVAAIESQAIASGG